MIVLIVWPFFLTKFGAYFYTFIACDEFYNPVASLVYNSKIAWLEIHFSQQ